MGLRRPLREDRARYLREHRLQVSAAYMKWVTPWSRERVIDRPDERFTDEE